MAAQKLALGGRPTHLSPAQDLYAQGSVGGFLGSNTVADQTQCDNYAGVTITTPTVTTTRYSGADLSNTGRLGKG